MGVQLPGTPSTPCDRCPACGTLNPRLSYIRYCIGCGRSIADGERARTPRPRGQGPRRRLVEIACWSYVASLALIALVMWTLGDRWWAATLILYGPRWVWGIPLPLLVPSGFVLGRRAVMPLLLSVVLLLVPILGFRAPLGNITGGRGEGFALQVVSWNAQGREGDHGALADFVNRTLPDLIVLQEWPEFGASWPFAGPGWYTYGERGLGLASRYPIEVVEHVDPRALEHRSLMTGYRIATPAGRLLVYNLHLETPREGMQAVIDGDLGGVATMRDELALRREHAEIADRFVVPDEAPVLVAGDFNMTDDSTIFRRHWPSFRDAFNVAGLGFGRTKFTRWHGVRIDHILLGPGWRARRCYVGPEMGSDHRPVVAELSLPSPMPK